jgi:hypothetical protein
LDQAENFFARQRKKKRMSSEKKLKGVEKKEEEPKRGLVALPRYLHQEIFAFETFEEALEHIQGISSKEFLFPEDPTKEPTPENVQAAVYDLLKRFSVLSIEANNVDLILRRMDEKYASRICSIFIGRESKEVGGWWNRTGILSLLDRSSSLKFPRLKRVELIELDEISKRYPLPLTVEAFHVRSLHGDYAEEPSDALFLKFLGQETKEPLINLKLIDWFTGVPLRIDTVLSVLPLLKNLQKVAMHVNWNVPIASKGMAFREIGVLPPRVSVLRALAEACPLLEVVNLLDNDQKVPQCIITEEDISSVFTKCENLTSLMLMAAGNKDIWQWMKLNDTHSWTFIRQRKEVRIQEEAKNKLLGTDAEKNERQVGAIAWTKQENWDSVLFFTPRLQQFLDLLSNLPLNQPRLRIERMNVRWMEEDNFLQFEPLLTFTKRVNLQRYTQRGSIGGTPDIEFTLKKDFRAKFLNGRGFGLLKALGQAFPDQLFTSYSLEHDSDRWNLLHIFEQKEPKITSLELTTLGRGGEDTVFDLLDTRFKHSNSLETLIIRNPFTGYQNLFRLFTKEKLPRLRHLMIPYVYHPMKTGDLLSLSEMEHVYLDMKRGDGEEIKWHGEGNPFDPSAFETFCRQNPKLQYLHLSLVGIPKNVHIKGLSLLPELKNCFLQLPGDVCYRSDLDAIWNNCPNLLTFYFGGDSQPPLEEAKVALNPDKGIFDIRRTIQNDVPFSKKQGTSTNTMQKRQKSAANPVASLFSSTFPQSENPLELSNKMTPDERFEGMQQVYLEKRFDEPLDVEGDLERKQQMDADQLLSREGGKSSLGLFEYFSDERQLQLDPSIRLTPLLARLFRVVLPGVLLKKGP